MTVKQLACLHCAPSWYLLTPAPFPPLESKLHSRQACLPCLLLVNIVSAPCPYTQSELVAAKRHMDGLQRLAGYGGRPGDAEAAAAAAERAGRAEEALRRLEAELGGLRQRYAQVGRRPVVHFFYVHLRLAVLHPRRRAAFSK